MKKCVITPYQQGMYLEQQYHEDAARAYTVPVIVEIEGCVEHLRLVKAFQLLIQQFPILSGYFSEENEQVTHVCTGQSKVSFDTVLPSELDILIEAFTSQTLKVNEKVVDFRVIAVHTQGHKTVLFFGHHHLVADGYSIDLMIKTYFIIYDQLMAKETFPILEQEFDYYASALHTQDQSTTHYWDAKTFNHRYCTLPVQGDRPPLRGFQGSYRVFSFDQEQIELIQELTKKYRCSTTLIVLTCCYILLSKYNDEPQVSIGVALQNRTLLNEAIIGCFTNVLPIELHVDTAQSVAKLLRTLIDEVSQTIEYGSYPAIELISRLQKERDPSFHPLYQVMFSSQVIVPHVTDKEYKVCKKILHNETSKFDLTFHFYHDHKAHSLGVEFNTQLYSNEWIQQLWESFTEILQSLTREDVGTVGDVVYISQKTRTQLLDTWNHTTAPYPFDKTLHALFMEQAMRTPNMIAAIYQDQSLSYQTLDIRSNQLAHYLSSHFRITRDALIGLAVTRSFEMLIGILGILKAGAAYVPLDPDLPMERLRLQINDALPVVILVQESCALTFHQFSVPVVVFEDIPFPHLDKTPLPIINDALDLAYVMYTSGTTGVPKGVMLTHTGIVNRLHWMQSRYPLSSKDVVLHKTPYIFDVSVWELLWAHQVGAKIVIAIPDGHKDPDYLYQVIHQHQVTVLHMVPSMLAAVLEAWKHRGARLPESISTIFCSGEVLPKTLVNDLYSCASETVEVHNLYGPTEASIDVTAFACLREGTEVCIGRPIDNMQVYVLDHHLQPRPIGMMGELYLGGVGIARGYLNQPELTRSSFVANPYGPGRLYKTGDVGRWRFDGNIEFIGRNDSQVKIRGFRIECGEIETTLLKAPGVNQVVVIFKSERLLAYYVGHAKSAELKTYLEARLPDYMIPEIWITLDSFPLTSNGKLDKNALPAPKIHTIEHAYVEPKTPLEKALCLIWQEVLGVEKVGIRDDFFRLGGHSILAIHLLGRINRELNCQIAVKTLFTVKTIEKLIHFVQETYGTFKYQDYLIHSNPAKNNQPIPQVGGVPQQAFALNNVQQAYLYGRNTHFELGNTSAHCYQEFLFETLDIPKLERAFNRLLQRHRALRTIFSDQEQWVLEDVADYQFEIHRCQHEDELLAIRNRLSHKIYEPNQYPLFDIEISEFAHSFRVHFSMDLLLMDGRSYVIFMNEWAALYNDAQAQLALLNIHFSDYIDMYQRIRQSPFMDEARRYWEKKLPEYHFAITLPAETKPYLIKQPKFARLETFIDKESWGLLKEKAMAHGVGLTSVFLTLYGMVLLRWSHQDRVCINLTLFNRLPLHQDVNALVGDFTVLELFNYIGDKHPFADKVLQTHQQLWDDLEHNIFDGIDVQRLARKIYKLESTRALAPIVLSSMLGTDHRAIKFNGYQRTEYSITQTPQIHLDNQLHDHKEGLLIIWDYLEQLFAPDLIETLHQHYCSLIHYLAHHSWDSDLSDVLLPKVSHEKIIAANTAVQPVTKATLASLFDDQTLKMPDLVAVIYRDETYTYRYIAQASERLANHLWQHYGPQELIAVLCEKGVNQVVITLGIMKAGCAYLPLHVESPVERMHAVLQKSEVNVVVTSPVQYESFKNTSLMDAYSLLNVQELITEALSLEGTLPPIHNQMVAYVIFTSGSTGTPKGVTVTHAAAVNTILAVNQRLKVTASDRILALADLSFDLSVYDIFGILAAGGAIVFPEQEKGPHPDYWLDLLKNHHITLWNSVPQLMQLLHDANQGSDAFLPLRAVLLSGDRIEKSLVHQIKKKYNHWTLIGLGGATEGGIWSIWYELEGFEVLIPYGHAMPNQQVYVLNINQAHCPIGVVGEIYIGGQGVAVGYWKDEEKTNAQFI